MEKEDKKYDLEDRTLRFAKDIRSFVKKLPKNTSNFEDIKQLVRSSGSIGANYIEANEALSKKDFNHRAKISRKEAKETIYWLKLIDLGDSKDIERKKLLEEAIELMKIFGAIVSKSGIKKEKNEKV
jgi:four helix bundle protein